MPTYAYKCKKCNHEFDWVSKIDLREKPLTDPCPNCGEYDNIERVITSVGFGDPVRMGFIKGDSGMKEALQRIHEKTPGSRLDQLSTITKI